MREPVSALDGRVETGAVTVRDLGPRGMITLRGTLSDPVLGSACRDLTGQEVPEPGRAVVEGETGIAWMSPDEVLILVPHAAAPDTVARLRAALAGTHHLAVDVSDARAVVGIEGPYAREVLAKLCPADLSPAAFGPGAFRRSRLGQIAAAIWCEAPDRFGIICFRSVADYAFALLAQSARDGAVGHF